MASSMLSAENYFENLGLRIIVIVVDCKKHNYQNRIWTTVPPFIDSISNVDLKIVQEREITKYLSNLFIRYATIVILINCDNFPCRAKNLRLIIKTLESNESLRFKLKIIFTFYVYIPESYKYSETNFEFCIDTMFLDYFNCIISKLENTLLFYEINTCSSELKMKTFFDIIKHRPFISAQGLAMALRGSCVILTKGNVELYFYSVNPSLAIIINNYYFSNNKVVEYEERQGSLKDVLKLIQQFKISQTPYMIFHDTKSSDLLKLVNFLQHEDLSSLKCVYFITMTHGTTNNIIYTYDGKLNFIEDILQPIQSNVSLKNGYITFLNVHCRGSIDGSTMDYDDSKHIVPTKIPQLQPNTCVFYSVPDLLTSPRCPKSGSPFVNSFSKVYGRSPCPSNIETLSEGTTKELEDSSYYATLNCFEKSAELVVADGTTAHDIKPMPTNAEQTVSVYKSINEKCHRLFEKDNYNDLRNTNDKSQQPTGTSSVKTFCLYANKNESQFSENPDDFTNVRKLNKENRHHIMMCCKTETRNFYSFVRTKKTIRILNPLNKNENSNREILKMYETNPFQTIRDLQEYDPNLNFTENLRRKYQKVVEKRHVLELDKFMQYVENVYNLWHNTWLSENINKFLKLKK